MSAELEFALEAVGRAGDLILSFYQKSFQVREKSRDNPVTSADLAADSFLRDAFKKRFRKDAWLSEETADDPRRLDCRRVWIVDPLDGTREFVRGLPEFALSLALVEDGLPRLAIVSNPATGDLFHAETGRGVYRNGRRAMVSQRKRFAHALLLISHTEAARFRILERRCRIARSGSMAYRLALVAAGDADITVSLTQKNEWDVCAGTLIVQESGGMITDLGGEKFEFNRTTPRVRGVVAANPSLHAQATRWLTVQRILQMTPH